MAEISIWKRNGTVAKQPLLLSLTVSPGKCNHTIELQAIFLFQNHTVAPRSKYSSFIKVSQSALLKVFLGGSNGTRGLFSDATITALLSEGRCSPAVFKLTFRQFGADREVAGMRISTSTSEAAVYCLHQVRDQLLPEVKKFKYLPVLLTSGKKEAKDSLVQCVVKRQQSKVKLSIYWSVCVPSLMYVQRDGGCDQKTDSSSGNECSLKGSHA